MTNEELEANEQEACYQCGELKEEFAEGVCTDCCAENQRVLDMHNQAYDDWILRTEAEKEQLIRDAMR